MGDFGFEKRFEPELVPFDDAIYPWIDRCEPKLAPLVDKDYQAIRKMHFEGISPVGEGEKPLYLATAGAPCSGKSTQLDFELESGHDPRYFNGIKCDPDRWAMEYMNHTYRPMLDAGTKAKLGVKTAIREAYNRARPGSNIIASQLLNEAFSGRYNIIHGTTMTSPHVGNFLDTLGKAGYERRLMLCYCEDELRMKMAGKRLEVEAHYQVDPDDLVEKGEMFPQRMQTYFKHGDHILLLWKYDVDKPAVIAAEYKNGERQVFNDDAFKAFVNRYKRQGGRPDGGLPRWYDCESAYFDRDFGFSLVQGIKGQFPKPGGGSGF